MTDEELLTSVQAATFRYFWDYAHPTSGLARERTGSGDTCTSGGTGFGLMAICVAAERGFVSRETAVERLNTLLSFLENRAERYHGAWAHWIHGATGNTIPFSRYDDGGDIVETAYLAQGLLTVRRCFDRETPDERELVARATRLWEGIEWDWYLGEPPGKQLWWHWSPNHGWRMNHRIGGHFNECLIAYLLAIASPTHPIPADCYRLGWVGEPPDGYLNGHEYYGQHLAVGWPYGGPLFFTHYSFLGFDPRAWRDEFCDYFANNRAISLINRAWCADNPHGFAVYSDLFWGLTASDDPDGYSAHEPRHDNGTIAPTAALSAMPYVPAESIATLRHLYEEHGARIWGHCGFKDAFNPTRDWVADGHLAIDQGPIIVMIENHRSGLCWRKFMANPEIPAALARMGWTRVSRTSP
ncbi:MAG: beta-glucosidase [Verrucomicrobiales bacterium]|nr:beta-glucosidase [Verrucomicrobiales bacterium]